MGLLHVASGALYAVRDFPKSSDKRLLPAGVSDDARSMSPKRSMAFLTLLALAAFAGADDPVRADYTQDLEVENCKVRSTTDDFTDEVLRTMLACRAPGLMGLRMEYVYETGEHRLTLAHSVFIGGVTRRIPPMTFDFRAGGRPAFTFTATLGGGDAFVLLTDVMLEQFIHELTVDESDELIYRLDSGPIRRVPLPAEGMPRLIEEYQRRVATRRSTRRLPVSAPPTAIAASCEPEPPPHLVLLAIFPLAPIVELPSPGKAFAPPGVLP